MDGSSRLDSISIKYGSKNYRIPYDEIAFIYKAEGLYFLVDTGNLKLPIAMETLDDFPLPLRDNQFFRLTEDILLGRKNVRIANGLDKNVALASNETYENRFKIPKSMESAFRSWLIHHQNNLNL